MQGFSIESPLQQPNRTQSYYGGPPPVAVRYASDNALCHSPSEREWSFIWSTDGELVAIARDGVPVEFHSRWPKWRVQPRTDLKKGLGPHLVESAVRPHVSQRGVTTQRLGAAR